MSYESTYVCLYVCTYEYVRTCQIKKEPYKGTYLCMNAFWIKCRGYKRTKLVKYFYGFINPVTLGSFKSVFLFNERFNV